MTKQTKQNKIAVRNTWGHPQPEATQSRMNVLAIAVTENTATRHHGGAQTMAVLDSQHNICTDMEALAPTVHLFPELVLAEQDEKVSTREGMSNN